MSTTPLFTIITAVHNGASTIQRTIDSVSHQTFQDYEYIVMDGSSTDGTVALLKSAHDRITFWDSAPDSGVYHAFNKALHLARGTWIAFIGADDTYSPDALEQYRRALICPHNARAQFISSRVELLEQRRKRRVLGRAWSWPEFSKYMTVAHVGAIHHISLFHEYGFFDTSYRICGDYELLLRPRQNLRTAFLDRITAQMELGGISNRNVDLALIEQERAKRHTAGRSARVCALERRAAKFKDHLRRLVWY